MAKVATGREWLAPVSVPRQIFALARDERPSCDGLAALWHQPDPLRMEHICLYLHLVPAKLANDISCCVFVRVRHALILSGLLECPIYSKKNNGK